MIKTKSNFVFITAIVVFFTLIWQARLPLWNAHLQVDVWVWWERVSYWLANNSFAGLSGNEILPATLLYIFLPGFFIPYGWLNYGNYLPAALILNLAVLGLHLFFIKNKLLFLLSLLALGPILLFRFDALVTLLVLAAFWAFERRRPAWSGLALGLAAGMKVFPALFLPYLGLILWRQNQKRHLARFLLGFFEALILPVLGFTFLGGNWDQVAAALSFHRLKLISIESVVGTVITGWSLLTRGGPPPLLAGYGIWAVPGPAELFNRLWLVPVGLVYYWLWRRRDKQFSWQVPLALTLVFLVFSKNLNPQYLWWFMVFLPQINLGRPVWLSAIGAAWLNQLVYPVFYTRLIEDFYRENQAYWVYGLLVLRNGLIVYLTWKILYPFWSKTKGKLARK